MRRRSTPFAPVPGFTNRRVHVAERGRHGSEFALLATGGGGPLHGCEVAKRLGITRVVCPPSAGVAFALGLLMAPARVDRVATVAKRLSAIDWAAFEKSFRDLERDAREVIGATLDGKAKVTVARLADLRFLGQGFELVTPLPRGPYAKKKSPAAIRNAFLDEYERIFRKVPPVGEIEVINIRVALTAPVGRAALEVERGKGKASRAPKGKRRGWLASREKLADMPVYDRYALPAGVRLKGPAIIEEASTTVIVPAGARAHVDRSEPYHRSLTGFPHVWVHALAPRTDWPKPEISGMRVERLPVGCLRPKAEFSRRELEARS